MFAVVHTRTPCQFHGPHFVVLDEQQHLPTVDPRRKELWSERVLSGVGCSRAEGWAMQITKRWLCTGAIALAVGAVPARAGAQDADIDGGRRLFQGMCVECHGAGGTGGDAPSLNRDVLSPYTPKPHASSTDLISLARRATASADGRSTSQRTMVRARALMCRMLPG